MMKTRHDPCLPVPWRVAVAIALVLACCSHQKVSRTDAAPADASHTGGSIPEVTVGVASTGGAISTGDVVSTGGVTSTGGMTADTAQDAGCDTVRLMRKITDGAQGVQIPGGCAATPDGTDGAVLLDVTGKVTAITGIYYTDVTATRATVDSLSTERWPCLANQTVLYTCANPYIGP